MSICPRITQVSWHRPGPLGDGDILPLARTKAEDLSEEQAATMIQCAWRQRTATRLYSSMLRAAIRPAYDPVTGDTYYYNSITGAVSWTKPRALVRAGVRRKAKDMTHTFAACRIQSVWRSVMGRRAMRQAMRRLYRKVHAPAELQEQYQAQLRARKQAEMAAAGVVDPMDPGKRKAISNVHLELDDSVTEAVLMYYVNMRTGRVQWVKPQLMGWQDLTPITDAQFRLEMESLALLPRYNAIIQRLLDNGLNIDVATALDLPPSRFADPIAAAPTLRRVLQVMVAKLRTKQQALQVYRTYRARRLILSTATVTG